MASSTTADYFTSRPAIRSRQASNIQQGATPGGGSPRTPLLGRSISGQYGSPGTPFRSEQEEYVVYELGARHLSAGFAGESRPRCILPFGPGQGMRVGDYRAYEAGYERPRRKMRREEDWGREYELYRTDVRGLDLGLVEDKLERAVRNVHAEYLQLPNKTLKAVFAVPSLLPTPLMEVVLRVLFNHYAQPPSVMVLTTPVLACVGAGLRNALVVDVGWEETVVTAIGEYKEVHQRRSVRAGKMLTREMARMVEREVKSQNESQGEDSETEVEVPFEHAEDLTRRMAWCRPREKHSASRASEAKLVKLPHPTANQASNKTMNVFFNRLSNPAETALVNPDISFADNVKSDDHESSILNLMYTALLSLPLDLRALTTSRIIFTGGCSALPGLKHRLLQELSHLLETRGWDSVSSYGSTEKARSRVQAERSANIATLKAKERERPPANALKPAEREALPPHARPHDDEGDSLTSRVERRAGQRDSESVKGVVRGVGTVGPWAGASLVASLRVKGVVEVEREEFLRHGLRDGLM